MGFSLDTLVSLCTLPSFFIQSFKCPFDSEECTVSPGTLSYGYFETYYQGQLPPALEPVFLSPANTAIIGAIGAPIGFIAGVTAGVIGVIITGYDFEDDDNDDESCIARPLRRASLRPLLSLVFGVTMGALIFRLRDPSIFVGYSALCGLVGVLVLAIPLVLFETLLQFLATKGLSPAYTHMAEMFSNYLSKGYELWNVAAKGEVALPM